MSDVLIVDPMATSAAQRNEIFAANRAVGRIEFTVDAGPGGSRRGRVHEAGALRVRFPAGNSQRDLDAVIVNTSGGMAGGDRFGIDVKVGAGAHLTATTAAAEKVYRSLGPDSKIGVTLEVGPGGTLAWLPQETIVFDQVRLSRTIDVSLARDANLLLAEAMVFGRSAMGEAVLEGRVFDRWRLRVDRSLIFAEMLRLDGQIAQRLSRRAVARGGVAMANIIKYPGNDGDVAAVRAMQECFAGEVGASAWNGVSVVRLVASDGAALRRDLVSVVTALHAAPLPRLWSN